MVRAMARLFVLIIGIVWASLLLISWGGAVDIQEESLTEQSVKSGS